MAGPYTVSPLLFLMEDILNENVPDSPRGATLARVAAGSARRAGNRDEVIAQLQKAYEFVEGQRTTPWRDALRANVELTRLIETARSHASETDKAAD